MTRGGKRAGAAMAGLALAALATSGAALAQGIESHRQRTDHGDYSVECVSGEPWRATLLVPPEAHQEAAARVRAYAAGAGVFEAPGLLLLDGQTPYSCAGLLRAALPGAPRLQATSAPVALTVAERDADNARLTELVQRTRVEMLDEEDVGEHYQHNTHVNYTFASQCGDVTGLAMSTQWVRTNLADVLHSPEAHLLFSTHHDEPLQPRDPTKQELPSVSITRNDANSDTGPNGQYHESGGGVPMDLKIHVAIAPALDPDDFGDPLHIDNLEPGTPTSARPARGLAGVVASPHCQHDPQTLREYQVLMKVLRARACDNFTVVSGNNECYDSRMLIHRDTEPHHYIAEMHSWAPDGTYWGRLSVKLRITHTEDGRMDLLWIDLDMGRTNMVKPSAFYVAPPKFRGERWRFGDSGYAVIGPGGAHSSASDMNVLLANTTWND